MLRSRGVGFCALPFFAFVLVAADARAEWPMQRHDVARTGTTTGTGNLTAPAPYFRYYLGGSLGTGNLVTFDVDEDGVEDFLMLTGGRLVARNLVDESLWSSPPRGYTRLGGLADMNGDGVLDLVVTSSDQAFVLDPRTGAELWAEPKGELGTLGGFLLADFDGDGSTELLVVECGCCGVNSGYPGAIYSFADGFAAPRKMWEIPRALCGLSRSLTVIDSDGTGPLELVVSDVDALRIFRPSTGELLATSEALGDWTYRSNCWPGELDGTPGDELMCVLAQNNSSVTDRWRVMVLNPSGDSLPLLWREVLAPDATGEARVLDPVVDLDGDGSLELIVSVADEGTWETRIYDAASGGRRATIPDAIVMGHLTTSTGLQLVTRSSDALRGWTLSGAGVAPTWRLEGHEAFAGWDLENGALRGLAYSLVTTDLNDDGRQDLITTRQGPDGEILLATSIDAATTEELARFDLPAGTAAQAVWTIPPVTTAGATLAVSYSDGFLRIHDRSLNVATQREFDPVVLRTGGYYAAGGWRDLRRAPVTGALGAGEPDAVVVSDARGALLRLDAAEASWASGPVRVWERLGTWAPTLADGLVDGGRGVACLSYSDPTATSPRTDVVVLAPDGTERWRATPADGPLLDLVPGAFDGDGVTDLVFHWGEPSNTLLRTRAVSGADGSTLWDAAPIEAGAGRQPAGLSVGRFDGDDLDDVYFQAGSTRVVSGVDGSELARLGGPSYFLPTLVDLDDDPRPEVVLHGGVIPIRVADDDLGSLLWTSDDDDRPFPYGSVVSCTDGRTLLVSGSWAFASRIKATELEPTFGNEREIFLASGSRYGSSAELEAAGAFGGQLTSVTAHANLAGDGQPAALVGSTDGWLYWVNPCSGELEHAIDFGVAVGQSVYGDTDGDGFDEILVSAADGFLYGLRQLAGPQPDAVFDIDPAMPTSDADVDSVVSSNTWVARWTEVAGTVRYEVGVFAEDGTPLLSERWRDVGTDTRATLSGLELRAGRRYYAAVRAWSTAGPSVDTLSDGAVVRSSLPTDGDGGAIDPDAGVPAPDGGRTPSDSDEGGGAGCACRAPGTGPTPALASLLLFAWLWRRRISRG